MIQWRVTRRTIRWREITVNNSQQGKKLKPILLSSEAYLTVLKLATVKAVDKVIADKIIGNIIREELRAENYQRN